MKDVVDLVLSGMLSEKSQDHMRLRDKLASLLRNNPETLAYVHDLLRDGPKTKEHDLLAHRLSENPTAEDVVLLLKCEIATGRSFLGWRSVQAAGTAHVPSETWRGAFEVPVPSTRLRKELLALTTHGGKSDAAARCLTGR